MRSSLACCGCAFLVLLFGGAGNSVAQQSAPLRQNRSAEIAPFRLTGVEGYVLARYLRDNSSTAGQGSDTRQTLSTLSEELFIMTHSYVYHPGLLSLDLGGGPIIDRTNYGGDVDVTNEKRHVYNLSGRATILRDKPYNGALFYDLRNQTRQLGPAQAMLTEDERSGFEFALLNPVTPVPLRLDATHETNKGAGSDQIIDDRIDRVRARMDANIGTSGSSAFQYQGTHQVSKSGSPGLPIQASTTDTALVNLDTRVNFGAGKQYELTNFISANNNRYAFSQSPSLDYNDLRFGLDLRSRHSEMLESYGRLDLNSSKQGEQEMGLTSLRGSLTYRPNADITGTLGANGENSRVDASDTRSYGLNGTLQYQHALRVGELRAGYGFAYLQREQDAAAQQAIVVGEAVTLNGTTLVTLNRELIDTGSVTVSNTARTQTYVEGIDYLLTVVGLATRIQRTVTGNIIDGQQVLVDYSYEFGGSYALTQLDQNVNLSWVIGSYLNSYIRLTDSAPRLTSGTPTAPINPGRAGLIGTRGEIPFDWWLYTKLGGYIEYENRREEISPYKRSSLEAYAQVALPWVGNSDLRLGTRRSRIDYDFEPLQGVELVAYDLRLSSRLPYNIFASLDAYNEIDTGTPLTRKRFYLSARANWRMRKLQATFELTRTNDAQGESQRARTYAQFTLRRDF